jgi:hypothetical protein
MHPLVVGDESAGGEPRDGCNPGRSTAALVGANVGPVRPNQVQMNGRRTKVARACTGVDEEVDLVSHRSRLRNDLLRGARQRLVSPSAVSGAPRRRRS